MHFDSARVIVDLRPMQLISTSSLFVHPEVDAGSRAGPETPSSPGCKATSGTDSVRERLGVETSTDGESPAIATKAGPE